MLKVRNQSRIGASALSMALLALIGAANPALAQDNTNPQAAQADEELKEGEAEAIVITGTNISGVKAVGSQALTINRDQMLNMGKSSLSEVLQTLPQVQNASGTFSPASNGGSGSAQNGAGGNTTRGNAINFRGVGQGATLTLVDGHRITPNGTATAFTEANQVPMAAIERIEVIADGASAIYGSDAIAGVINYVLRKDFTGLEISSRYTFGAYDNDDYAISASGGLSWNPDFGRGNIIGTFEYGRRMPYVRGLNERLRSDQRPYGGNDGRVNGNAASVPLNGNIVVPTVGQITNPNFAQGGSNTYYALPLGSGNFIPTLADLKEVRIGSCTGAATPTCATYPNVIDRSDYEDYIGSENRYQAAIFFNQEIGGIEIYDEFFWTRTEQFTRTYLSGNQSTSATVAINPGSQYYIAGIPNTVRSPFPPFVPATAQPYDVQINLLARMPADAPRFGNQNPNESFNNTFGVKAKLFGDWRAESYYTFGQNKNCGVCYLGNYIALETTNGISGAAAVNALQQLVNKPLSDPLHVNPYSSDPFTQAQLAFILGTNSQYSQNWSHDIVTKVDGGLFDLPAGRLKVALGGEFYYGIQKLQNDANRPPDPGPVITADARARTTRKQYAAFVETYIPAIGREMEVPLIQELTFSAALRYDHYSDFGDTTNGKLSATWEVNDDLQFRGSWGTSFRAPGLPEINGGVFSLGIGSIGQPGPGVTGIDVQPNGQANVLNFLGNNPNLKAETGKNWQVGVDFTPQSVPGLRLSATYYNLSYKNKMGGSGVPFAIFTGGPFATPALLAQYSAYVIPVRNTNITASGCTLDPKLEPYTHYLYAVNAGFNPRDYCNINVVVDGRSISAANTFQDGLDVTASYIAQAKIGTFNFNLSASKVFSNTQRLVDGAPLISVLDTIANPVSMRARGSVGFMSGPFSATLMGSYVGPYTNDKPISIQGVTQAVSRVGAWTTFDLNLSVSFPKDEERYSFMQGTRLGVTVTNLFESQPPMVQSTMSGNSSIDLFTHNAMGRFFQIQLTKAF